MGEYKDIAQATCKKYRGYKVYKGKRLEKQNNLCSRQCKFQHDGEELPATVQVKCKCKMNKNCGYVFKMKGVFKGWMSWGATDSWGNFYVDKKGVPSKQAQCIDPNGIGTWSEWSAEGPCEGTCPDNSFHKHRRTCSNGNCDNGSSIKNGRKCLRVEFDGKLLPTEPALYYSKIERETQGRQCSVGIAHASIDVWTEAHGDQSYEVYFNVGDYCHFPSFGKGWFDQVMDNGDHVQMGVKCENDWNYEDYSIAKKGEKCRLICKNLSGTDNVYRPIDDEYADFQCRSPLPIFAFQDRKCHKELVRHIIKDVYSYYVPDKYDDSNSNKSNLEKNARSHDYKGDHIAGRKSSMLCKLQS